MLSLLLLYCRVLISLIEPPRSNVSGASVHLPYYFGHGAFGLNVLDTALMFRRFPSGPKSPGAHRFRLEA